MRNTIRHSLLLFFLLASCWAQAQVVTDPATGHSYEYVPFAAGELTTWEAALDAAALRQFEGQNGYLVSITSAEENAFIVEQFSADVPVIERIVWIGAFEPLDDGLWVWAAGPEAGQPFWDENLGMDFGEPTPPFNYANWATGEPNNALGAFDEFYALIFLSEQFVALGTWFDDNALDDDFVPAGYIVEYSLLPESQPVPVNSPLGLALLLALMLMVGLYRTNAVANT